jgi:hypothetical protein
MSAPPDGCFVGGMPAVTGLVAEKVTSGRPPAMTPPERKRRQRQRDQVASESMRFVPPASQPDEPGRARIDHPLSNEMISLSAWFCIGSEQYGATSTESPDAKIPDDSGALPAFIASKIEIDTILARIAP